MLQIGFVATEKISTLKLIKLGISNDFIIVMSTVMSTVLIFTSIIIAKYISSTKPISIFKNTVPYK